MQIDPADHDEPHNYKLLTNLVIPRPIAWVTSLGADGVVNLAPFSFFNAVGSDPLFIVLGIGQGDRGIKDTARNIQATGDFVVNMVTEPLLAAMNLSAADFPPGVSEMVTAGLDPAPSVRIQTPRLAAAEVSLECTLHQVQPLGVSTLVIGQVVMIHVADALIDAAGRVTGFHPIGRLGSPSVYCRTTDRFEVPRIDYADGLAGR